MLPITVTGTSRLIYLPSFFLAARSRMCQMLERVIPISLATVAIGTPASTAALIELILFAVARTRLVCAFDASWSLAFWLSVCLFLLVILFPLLVVFIPY